MPFTLPILPYNYQALEPAIDARTLEIHYTKHHQAYIDKLNAALQGHNELANKPIEELLANLAMVPEEIREAVRNHGGGHYNHSLFWQIMAPAPAQPPTGELAAAINKDFGSFDELKKIFTQAAAARFGSGWAWLVWQENKLTINSTPNQDNPLTSGGRRLLTLDIWEHAYYLKYQNRRIEYIDAWWNVVNWPKVIELLLA
ncbi:MAG: superoxide dismutase [Candidatus Komeilibacteria bacterium]|nr:superoxide dismutase [Candidatus Komeilibacteria bacterium]